MNLKSKKGYSLIEIGVGILILTVFLICSVALFNGCYNTYRMIQQRNLAVNLAVSNMEDLLQTDSDVLTGFFEEEIDEENNISKMKATDEFKSYVNAEFDTKFKTRYAKVNNINESEIGSVSDEELETYIFDDREFLISSYIADEINEYSSVELESEEVQSGNYALLSQSVTETGNAALLNPGIGEPSAVLGEMAIRKTVLRLPLTEDNAFGNKVLKVKVEVLYTNKINLNNLTKDDVKSITLESIKIAK